MNNEKILNIMENLSKAVYDIAATTKHIYKDEHPTGPTMPMPTMPGQPKFPPPPALWSNQTNQFPPRPQPWPAPGPHPMVTQQDMDFSNYVFKQVFHPNDNSSLKPHPTKPNEFCNMQDYTFQRMNGNVPAKAKILSDPFMKPNQNIESDPDKLFNNIDLGGGNPEPIRNLVKENPDAVNKAVQNLGMMKTLGSPCWDIAKSDELEKEIDSIRVAINVAVRNCDTEALKEKSNRLIGLSLARSYLQFGESDTRKKLLQEEMKDNLSALQVFNDAVSRAEAERDKELKESLRQYEKSQAVTDSSMGVGDNLKDSMDNWGKQKPVERNVPINPHVDAMALNLRPNEADVEKNYLASIDAKETVGKMSAVLEECSRLTNEPAVPGNPVLDEEMNKEVPETPVVPEPETPKKEIKKTRKKTKTEPESPKITAASAW
jgi:hypothetical protein